MNAIYLAYALLTLRNGGTAPVLQQAPSVSLETILTTLRAVVSPNATIIVGTNFYDVLFSKVLTANNDALPVLQEPPLPVSLESIFWTLCIVENEGNAPSLSEPLNASRETILASITFPTSPTGPLITDGLDHAYLFGEPDTSYLEDSGATPASLPLYGSAYGTFTHGEFQDLANPPRYLHMGVYSESYYHDGQEDSINGSPLTEMTIVVFLSGYTVPVQNTSYIIASVSNTIVADMLCRIGFVDVNGDIKLAYFRPDDQAVIIDGYTISMLYWTSAFCVRIRENDVRISHRMPTGDGNYQGINATLESSQVPQSAQDLFGTYGSAFGSCLRITTAFDPMRLRTDYKGPMGPLFVWRRFLSDDEVDTVMDLDSTFPWN